MSWPTDFQKQVWAVVPQILPGKVATYGDIATALDSSALAVGRTFHHIPNELPWWRVLCAERVLADYPKELYLTRIALLKNGGVRVGVRVGSGRKWWWPPEAERT